MSLGKEHISITALSLPPEHATSSTRSSCRYSVHCGSAGPRGSILRVRLRRTPREPESRNQYGEWSHNKPSEVQRIPYADY